MHTEAKSEPGILLTEGKDERIINALCDASSSRNERGEKGAWRSLLLFLWVIRI